MNAQTRDPLDDLVNALTTPEADTHARVARLAAAAEQRGLLDVSYRTLDTAIGTLTLAATTNGLVSVTFDGTDPEATLARLAAELSPRLLRNPAAFDDTARQLEALVAGTRERYTLPLDYALATGFRRSVVHALAAIPRGTVQTYGEIAAAVGSPLAVRAVGTACRKNPLPIVVPCHRVVRADGSLGQYAGGAWAKEHLLTAEHALR